MQRWRVPLGFACGIIFVVLARPETYSLIVGGFVALLGLGLRAWSAGHIRKNSALAITGPYAYTRNPLYFGSFLMGLGFTVAAGRTWLWIVFAALFLGIYLPVMRVEARTLVELFGEDYRVYARSVPLFFPRFIPYRVKAAETVKFDGALYLRYREYQAAIGSVIAWTVLALKALYLGLLTR
jgi:protein-S-isoprenylcysteine O-methyltransferase Ste14